jgi:hypothetical protein
MPSILNKISRINNNLHNYNMIIKTRFIPCQQKYPEFGLTGKLLAQGEDIEDRWQLYIENGEVKTRELAQSGKEIECPHCHQKFVYNS